MKPETSNKRQSGQPDNVLDQHYEVMKEMGDCYAGLGDGGRARECYLGALDLAPNKAQPHVGLGVLAIQDGRSDDALAAFSTAKRLDPNCAEAYGGLAMVYQQKAEYAKAFEMYLTCLELDVDNLSALLGLFQTSCQMGTFGKVIQFLELYLDKHPGDTSVLFCLSSLYVKEERFEDAAEVLRRVLALEPDKKEATELLADVERRLAACQTAGAANR